MSKIVEMIKTIPHLRHAKGCTTGDVKAAQEQLDLVFPEEYVDYVKAYGGIQFYATEWTGLNIPGELNTVAATQRERQVNPYFPDGYFVIEDYGVDAKLAVVNQEGAVFLLQRDKMTPICPSLSEYLSICTNRKPAR